MSSSTVSFSGKGLKLNQESDAKEIVDAINNCEDLQTLNLEGNTLGIEAAKSIGKALESKPNLTCAHLKDIFTGRLKTEVPDAIRFLTAGITLANAQLTELYLSDNAFGPIGIRALLPFLKSDSCKTLKILQLNNNGLGIEGGKLLATALKDLEYLESFTCGRNRLENDAAIAVGKSLSCLTRLKKIEMPQNGIRAEGMEALAQAVRANKDLEILNLNDNTMTSRGGEYLASALQHAKNIQVINFGDCLIRKAGCRALIEALIKGGVISNVRELILNGNEIGGKDLTDLVLAAFSERDSETEPLKLDLGSNNFGEDAVQEMKKELGNISLSISDDEGVEEETEEYEDEESGHDEGEDGGDEEEVEEDASLGDRQPDVDEVTKLVETETSVDTLCEQFVNLSIKTFDDNNQTLPPSTLKASEQLLKAAIKNTDSFTFANSMLVQMGLLKGEEKKTAEVKDLRGPFLALSHSIGTLDKTQKDVFQIFIGKPHKASDQAGKFKHKLMQALFV